VFVENPYDKKNKNKAQKTKASQQGNKQYSIRDTNPALSGIGGATMSFNTGMEEIYPLQLPSQMPDSSNDELEGEDSIPEEPQVKKKQKKRKKAPVRMDDRRPPAQQEKKEVSTHSEWTEIFHMVNIYSR
jgi:hypothetical protein